MHLISSRVIGSMVKASGLTVVHFVDFSGLTLTGTDSGLIDKQDRFLVVTTPGLATSGTTLIHLRDSF